MSIKEQKLNNLFEAVTALKDYWLGLNKNTEDIAAQLKNSVQN